MNPYFEQKILGAAPLELVTLLYQRAISSVQDARVHLREGRIAQRGVAISNAYAAIAELVSSLHDSAAPGLTKNLRDLYFYMQGRLLTAMHEQSDCPLVEVRELLMTLADAWNTIERQIGPRGGELNAESQKLNQTLPSSAPRHFEIRV